MGKAVILIRTYTELRDQLQALAASHHRSMAQEIIVALELHLDRAANGGQLPPKLWPAEAIFYDEYHQRLASLAQERTEKVATYHA